MDKIIYYIKKYKIWIIIILIIMFILLTTYYIFVSKNNYNNEELEIVYNSKIEEESMETTKYIVDIKGCVENPGVYTLNSDSRIIDVINIAGGLKEGANTEYINLSKKIEDEMVIVIYSNEDLKNYDEKGSNEIQPEFNNAYITYTKENTKEVSGKISINYSSIDELMTLNGIGKSKAQAIVDYRNKNGLFKDISEITNVPGIGDSIYSKIKDNIKL